MAKRNLLHKNKLEDFKSWLISKEYKPKGSCYAYEVLRWKVKGSPMPIIFEGKSSQHFSCNDAAVPFVKRFIRG